MPTNIHFQKVYPRKNNEYITQLNNVIILLHIFIAHFTELSIRLIIFIKVRRNEYEKSKVLFISY